MRTSVFALAAALAVAPFAAQADTPLTVDIGGRVQATSQGYSFQWPGVYFEGRFKGDRLNVHFAPSGDIFAIVIDGKRSGTVTKPVGQTIELSKLGAGEHTVRVERLTEDQSNVSQFGGLSVPKAENALPAPAHARQIEFIGDSYTVGYGNTSGKQTCTRDEVWSTTDTSQAFGPVTAQHYNADYQVNAISGHGIVRNYNGSPGDPVPVAYPYLTFAKTGEYHDAAWAPQIIVIGLGTNDYSTPLNAGEKWATRDALHADYEATYVKFVQTLRARNPNAYFILMATDQVNGEIQTEVKNVIAALQTQGESRIAFIPMNALSFGGCDWHPTTADDAKVSQSLITFIDAHPELWQGK